MLKQKLKISLTVAIFIGSTFTSLSLALARPTYGQTCQLGVFPYNPQASSDTVGDTLNPYINYLSNDQCQAHLNYPNAYSPQPPLDQDNPLKPGSEAVRGPIALHEHGYFNDKNHEDPPGNYYYKSFVDKFEITIENDGYTNLDTEHITCNTPAPSGYNGDSSDLFDCQGSVSDTKLWGGTTVSKSTTTKNGKQVIKITWDFATVAPNTGRPQIYANNGQAFNTYNQDGTIKSTINLTDPYNRLLAFGVNLPTKDKGTIWSTTTTSRVLIGDLALNKANYPKNFNKGCTNNDVNNPDSGWCYLTPTGYPTETVSSNGVNRTYYWFPIGSVSNVWKHPPVQQTACADLTLQINQNGKLVQPNDVVADTPMTITVTPTFNPSNKNIPLKYKWSAGNTWLWQFYPKGTFKDNSVNDIDQTNPWAYDDDPTVYYTGGATGTIVAVDAYYADNTKADLCHQEFTITKQPPPKATCQQIKLTPNYMTAPGQTDYTATVSFDDGKSYLTTVHWDGTNGTFSKNADEQHQSGLSSNPYHYTNTFNTSSTTASVTAKVTSIDGANNSQSCQQGITINAKPSKPACLKVELSPTSLTAPGTTPLTATVTYTDGKSHNTELTWSQTEGTLSDAPIQQHQSSQPFKNNYTTNNNYGTVSAKVTKILEANIDNSPECQKGATISQGGNKPYCIDLIVKPDSLNSTGSTNLSAKAIFSDGKTYDTTVQWNGANGAYQYPTQQTNNSSNPFKNTFTITDENKPASASVAVIDIPDPNADNGPNCSNGKTIFTPPNQNKCEKINVYKNNAGQNCVNVTGNYNGPFTWIINGKVTSTFGCVTIPADTSWRVYATDEPNNTNCQDSGRTVTRPPQVSKGVRATYKGGSYTQVISIPSNQQQVEYQIQFNTNTNNPTTAFVTDDISDGKIDGKTNPIDTGNGHISYVPGSQSINRPACDDNIKENCYSGEIGNGGVKLTKVTGAVTITYKGQINDSAITPEICKEGQVCQEKYVNSARIDYETFNDNDEVIDSGTLTSNQTLVQIFCQYILTRAAGDIYLESDLNAGVDIRMCSKYTSTTGVLVVPGQPSTPNLVSTGQSEIMSLTHEICTEGQSGSIPDALKPFYGQTVVKNLSSQICEVKLQPGASWQQKTITNDIAENKTRISRWEPDYSQSDVNMSSVKLDPQYGDKQVYHIKDGNLTIDQPYTLSDGEGAKTFIVENGDLYIKHNISYGACATEKQPCTVKDIASLAFIVLNGSVYVDPSVTEMSGVYFVQEGDKTKPGYRQNSGRLYSLNNKPSYNQLVIYGSVYGDIQPLFLNRLFAGDPAIDEAGIVVRFDERIILNTPPGLREVINYSSTNVAR